MEVVQQAIAVGAEQRHVTRRRQQLRLQGLALGAGFGEAGGVADGPASPPGGQGSDAVQRLFTVGGDEHRIRAFGQLRHRAYTGHTFEAVVLRVDQPHLALVTTLGAALEGAGHAAPANERQVARGEHAFEIVTYHEGSPDQRNSGRSSSREIMWRWISEVPS
ncbi:hypothetical protein D9M73_216960 [compost metagenome]